MNFSQRVSQLKNSYFKPASFLTDEKEEFSLDKLLGLIPKDLYGFYGVFESGEFVLYCDESRLDQNFYKTMETFWRHIVIGFTNADDTQLSQMHIQTVYEDLFKLFLIEIKEIFLNTKYPSSIAYPNNYFNLINNIEDVNKTIGVLLTENKIKLSGYFDLKSDWIQDCFINITKDSESLFLILNGKDFINNHSLFFQEISSFNIFYKILANINHYIKIANLENISKAYKELFEENEIKKTEKSNFNNYLIGAGILAGLGLFSKSYFTSKTNDVEINLATFLPDYFFSSDNDPFKINERRIMLAEQRPYENAYLTKLFVLLNKNNIETSDISTVIIPMTKFFDIFKFNLEFDY